MSVDDAVATFLTEAGDLLELLERALLDLTSDPGRSDLIDEVFRALHTLKGSGAMFGFDALAAFTHDCETAFDRVRRGEVAASAELVSVVLEARDHMRGLLGEPEADHAGAGDALLRRLAVAVAAASGTGAQTPPDDPPETLMWISFTLPANCVVNGTNPALLLAELAALGEADIFADAADVPPLDELVPTECRLTWRGALRTRHPRSAIDEVFLFLLDDMRLEVETARDAEAAAPVEADALAPVPAPAPAAPGEPAAHEQPGHEHRDGQARRDALARHDHADPQRLGFRGGQHGGDGRGGLRSGHPDAAAGRQTAARLGDDQRGGLLAPHLLQLAHRLLDADLGPFAEACERLGERLGVVQLEGDRQGAHRRHHLDLAHVQGRAGRVRRAVGLDRHEHPQRPDPTVCIGLFPVQVVDVETGFGLGIHRGVSGRCLGRDAT